VRADDDLGLAMLWKVDGDGRHSLVWEIPRNAARGTYRLVVTAKQYRLQSTEFAVVDSTALAVTPQPAGDGRIGVALEYPEARRDVDLTWRPRRASAGAVRFRVGGRTLRATRARDGVFSVPAPAGAPVSVEAGAARDRWGNRNGAAVSLR
jgi:hypothetical protein